jgi:hypothetical protein
MWSAKEALFKWYSLGEIDFREHMQLRRAIEFHEEDLLLPFVLKKNEPVQLMIEARLFGEIVLSWVIGKNSGIKSD